jgi:hypothetical protein
MFTQGRHQKSSDAFPTNTDTLGVLYISQELASYSAPLLAVPLQAWFDQMDFTYNMIVSSSTISIVCKV